MPVFLTVNQQGSKKLKTKRNCYLYRRFRLLALSAIEIHPEVLRTYKFLIGSQTRYYCVTESTRLFGEFYERDGIQYYRQCYPTKEDFQIICMEFEIFCFCKSMKWKRCQS